MHLSYRVYKPLTREQGGGISGFGVGGIFMNSICRPPGEREYVEGLTELQAIMQSEVVGFLVH